MSINEEIIQTGRRRRRRHSAQFKAESVGACQQPGVSVAAVALARGLNANMLRNWVTKAERKNAPIAIKPAATVETQPALEEFMPVTLPASPATGVIRIDVRRKGRRVSIEWPASAAHDCALLLRELVK
jgi:transposase-like protein